MRSQVPHDKVATGGVRHQLPAMATLLPSTPHCHMSKSQKIRPQRLLYDSVTISREKVYLQLENNRKFPQEKKEKTNFDSAQLKTLY